MKDMRLDKGTKFSLVIETQRKETSGSLILAEVSQYVNDKSDYSIINRMRLLWRLIKIFEVRCLKKIFC